MKTKFIIDRKTWLRGEGFYESKLLRASDKKMCCLGQCALQDGYTKENIMDRANPSNIGWIRFCGERMLLAEDMMIINDDASITDNERESKLIERIKLEDFELEFIN